MKKTFLMIVMMLLGMAVSAQAQNWSTLGPMLADEVNSLTSMLESEFRSQGIPATASANYNTGKKSVDVVVDFGSLDVVPFLDDATMREMKEGFLSSFVETVSSDDAGTYANELANIMIKDGGTIRIVMKGAGKEKSLSITGAEIKKAMR